MPEVDQILFGKNLWHEVLRQCRSGLGKKFGWEPFSILDARQGKWQERKRMWLSLGIEGEVGRPDDLTGRMSERGEARQPDGTLVDGRERGLTWGTSPQVTEPGLNYYRVREKEMGRCASPGGSPFPACGPKAMNPRLGEPGQPAFLRGDPRGRPVFDSAAGRQSDPTGKGNERRGTMTQISDGTAPEIAERFEAAGNTTSIFDPVLCELMYRWFCPPGGQVVDPFCGGSVRGIVATYMERSYWGCDLRPEQIAANEVQANDLCQEEIARPSWHCGDARALTPTAPAADFILTCPPYGNLELYSELEGDLSNMSWPAFCAAYEQIIRLATERLKPDRFAAFVVGDFRDKSTGFYRNFPAMTQIFFRHAKLELYNEAILVTAVGSLPVRVGHFQGSRKLGKTHQNVLVFCKGDWRKAAAACEEVEQ